MKKIIKYWDRAALVLIMLMTGFLTFYAIGKEGYSNQYYAAAVKSMLTSFKNFFFASFDPGGYVTVDKPALGLWLQAVSAYIFGFHGWSIILPQALSAVISVAVMFHIVKRSFGKAAAIAASLILAFTPILIAVSRTNNLDASLVMVLLFATWVIIVAAERSSFKLLLLAMALVGVGFNIKMLEAFMVLPAFYLVYFLTSQIKTGKRIIHLLGATAVLLVVSLAWAVVVDMVPADKRPYIGSSKTNSVLELALGYNGIQRLTGNESGARNKTIQKNMANQNNLNSVSANTSVKATDAGTSAIIPGNNQPDGSSQPNTQNVPEGNSQGNGGQFQAPPNGMAPPGWSPQGSDNGNLPAPPNDGRNGSAKGNFPSGFRDGDDGQRFGGPGGIGGGPGGTQENGTKGVLRIFNKNLGGQISWFLPLAFFGILMLILRILRKDYGNNKNIVRYLILFSGLIVPMLVFFSIAGFYHRYYLSMLAPSIAALAGIGLVELWRAYMDKGWKWVLLPAALIISALLEVALLSRYDGWNLKLIPVICLICAAASVILIIIRVIRKDNLEKSIKIIIISAFAALLLAPAVWSYTPVMYGSQTTLPIAGPELKKGSGMVWNNGNMRNIQVTSSSSSQLIKFLLSKYKGEKFLIAVADAGTAEEIILETGKPVMAIGGFSGSDNILTVEKLEAMVKKGEIRYFELGGRGMGQNSGITAWVMEHGKVVSIDGSTTGASVNSSRDGLLNRFGSGTLYDLAPEKG